MKDHLEKARRHIEAANKATERAKLAIIRFWMIAEDRKGFFKRGDKSS